MQHKYLQQIKLTLDSIYNILLINSKVLNHFLMNMKKSFICLSRRNKILVSPDENQNQSC